VIPELDGFDLDELNNNPILNAARPVPLLGALLIAEGLVTREQLNACLLLQEQDHPDLPLGQIMLRCGYITDRALDQMLNLQNEFRASVIDAIDEQALPPADLTALVLHESGVDIANTMLSRLGVAATIVRDCAALAAALVVERFDLILADGDLLDDTIRLLAQPATPILVLPPARSIDGCAAKLPLWVRTLIARFVGQVRAQRREHAMVEILAQREYEMSVLATLSRRMTEARSSRAAMFQLMITIRDLFGVEAGTLYRFDRSARELIFEIVLGPHQEALYQQRLPIDRGIAGWVVRNGEPLLFPDVRRDSRFEEMFDHKSGFRTRSVLCVPLFVRGEVCGVIQLINKLDGDFNERDLMLLRILAAMGLPLDEADAQLIERDLGM